ncbi:MAG: hypothetical protein IKG85_00100 [Clostridia bacterium]|nr:hypothetical protein [Clostridia bacterium]
MKNQYIKIWSWMTELGLSAPELLALSVIHAYTTFKGGFDGMTSWLAGWVCLTSRETQVVLKGLMAKGLICVARGSGGSEVLKTTFLEGGLSECRPSGKFASHNINNIGDIDNIDPIDKKDKISNIDHIDHIDNIDTITGSKNLSDKTIGNIPEKTSPEPSEKAVKKEKPLTKEEIEEIIAPYENVADVPLEELSQRIRAFNERKARETQKCSAEEASQPEGRQYEDDLPVEAGKV